jgi:beta-glucanase (GH16 family)
MGRLLLGLVLAGSLLVATGPAQVRSERAEVALVATDTAKDRCGKRPPRKPNGKAWRCTFVDDFDGRRLNRRRWLAARDTTPPDGSNSACRRGRNVEVRRGQLRLTVRSTGQRVGCGYTTGSVSTYHRFSQKYGRFQARIKVRAAHEPGLQEAFWLWPDDRVESTVKWPAAGEIDIVETYSHWPNLAVPFLHYTDNDNGGPKPGLNTAWDCRAKRGRWHVYTLVWGPKRIEIKVNGRRCLVNTSGDPAFDKKYIIAFTQALGVRENTVTSRTPLPATMKVDYIRVWR